MDKLIYFSLCLIGVIIVSFYMVYNLESENVELKKENNKLKDKLKEYE